MAPTKKSKAEATAPPVNVEEVQLRLAQLGDQILRVKDDIEVRAKDYADSLSAFDVPYPLSCMTMSEGVLYAGSLDQRVLGIDAMAHTDRFQAVAESGVFSLQVLREAGVLCAGTESGLIQCWHCASSQAAGFLTGHTGRVSKLKVSPSETQLWSSSHDGTVRQWDMPSQTCLNIYQVSDYQVGAFEISGAVLYAAGWDSTVRAISVASGECLAVFKGHGHIIHAMEAREESDHIYTASGDHHVLQWKLDEEYTTFDRTPSLVLKGHIDSVPVSYTHLTLPTKRIV
eukprot:TRINITY_DN7474_c0_g1_i3.p1 TRINITY_DN7474_c0_g1~~TRINITY_DN7474_c0_g1_i3.p1  ORF type:complete len:286 (+),score=55.57 TRINITY_DN7474_c0_g1_i3:68-925(+)